MNFQKLDIAGAFLVEMTPFTDDRGQFARQFCKKELESQGIKFDVCQCNMQKNPKKGTLRGMHYQIPPYAEPKFITCVKGAIFDVMVDMRPQSPTYLQWFGTELTENNNRILYIPEYCAHGYKTLADDSTAFYEVGGFFAPQAYAGVRWNDPKIGIVWPETEELIINERDNGYELL